MRYGPVLLLALLAGCAPGEKSSPTRERAPVPPASAVPTPELEDMELRVRAILVDSRSRLLEDLGNASLWGRYGMVLDAHDVHAEAIAAYRQAVALDPHEFRWVYLLGHLLQLQELEEIDLADAEAALRKAAELRPDYAPVHVRLGQVLAESGDAAAARDAWRRAVDLDPADVTARCGLARAELSLGDADAALAAVRPAVNARPDSWEAQMTLARVLARSGDRDGARTAAAAARALPQEADIQDPELGRMMSFAVSSSACFKRAEALYQAGDFRQAILNLKVVKEVRPDYAPVYERLGWCFLDSGKHEKALENFRQAVALDSTLPRAHLGLASTLDELGRPDEAEAHARTGQRLVDATPR